MQRDEAAALERQLLDAIAKRRNLGGYSPDAADLLLFAETLYEVVRHIKDLLPPPPRKAKRR